MEDLVNPWKGRRVFLTGHTGFKGSWLALWLAAKGAQVRGYALNPEEPSLFASAAVRQDVDDVRGDIRDPERLTSALVGFSPEVVFHLAAQPLVLKSYADPVGTYATNVMGTVHVLNAVRQCSSARAVVCVTTDKCYDNHEWVWPYRETDPLGGRDPYASSKACAELVAAAYRESFFPLDRFEQHNVAIATVRAGNVIGGGDWSESRLVPDLIRGFISGSPVTIRNPMAVRPWQHVLDPLHGYLMLAEKLLAGQKQFATAFNLGPRDEDAWPVERMATMLATQWGGTGTSWVPDSEQRPHEARLLRLDSSRARTEFGWTPRLNVETALQWTADWYKMFNSGADLRQVTLGQIEAFEGRPGL